MRELSSTAAFLTSCAFLLLGASAFAYENDWRQVDEAIVYKGDEMYPPKFLDYNSTLKTNDGYIVFKSMAPSPRYETRNGKFFKNTNVRNFDGRFQYVGINCELKRFASSKQAPKFSSTWRDYTKDGEVYNNEWPKNVEKLICNKSGIKVIPHSVGEVLFLNYKKDTYSMSPPLEYDQAVELGILK